MEACVVAVAVDDGFVVVGEHDAVEDAVVWVLDHEEKVTTKWGNFLKELCLGCTYHHWRQKT